MIIKTRQIKGKGRGKELGFPTINMEIKEELPIDHGVYAGWFVLDGKNFKSAIHFGPTPTFKEEGVSLEAYLIDVDDQYVPLFIDGEIELDFFEKIRDVQDFMDIEDLVIQISKDVDKIRNILK